MRGYFVLFYFDKSVHFPIDKITNKQPRGKVVMKTYVTLNRNKYILKNV